MADENTLNIYFKRGSKKLFKDVKNIIIDQIDKFKGVKAVFMQMFYTVNGEIKSKIYSLNNEDGYNNAMNILNAKPFEMTENPFDEKDNYTIQVSDDASVSNFQLPISCIIGFRLTNKKHLTNKAGNKSRYIAITVDHSIHIKSNLNSLIINI